MAKKLTRKQLEEFLIDMRHRQDWRVLANRDAAYYDGDQLTPEELRMMEERGLPPLIRNKIRPVIDLVLGMEAKNQRDWKILSDDDESTKVADALSIEMKRIERQTQADRAISDAYSSMVRTGIGWIEVAYNPDPFGAEYRVNAIHRNEMYFDYRAQQPDMSDARYMIRKKWFDIDTIKNQFPEKQDMIKHLMDDNPIWDDLSLDGEHDELTQLYNSLEETSIRENEWRDTNRKRLCLQEVWYKVWDEGFVINLPNRGAVEFDEDNVKHRLLVETGLVELKKHRFLRPRLSWWIGPVMLEDVVSPYPHQHFPYVPFIAWRKDITGDPIGLVRQMISPQDEINARLSKMMWLLSTKRIIADSDATKMHMADVAREAARPDGIIFLDPHRTNKTSDAFRVESDLNLSREQFSVLQDANMALQEVAGVFNAQLGSDSNAASGVAINSLVEQGSTTLAEMNDNYRFSKQRVGELLLALIREQIGTNQMSVMIERDGAPSRDVTLNQQAYREDGTPYITNSVENARLRMSLTDIPNTPSYRQQQFTMMAEIAKSMPPEMAPMFADFMVGASDMPGRETIMKRIRQQLGINKPIDEMNEEEMQQFQAQQQQQAEEQALLMQEQMTKVEKLVAEVEKIRAEVALTMAEAEQTEVETAQSEDSHGAELARTAVEVTKMAQEPKEANNAKS